MGRFDRNVPLRSRAERWLLTALGCLLLAGCYTNRYIPDGSYRLDETVQTVVMADSSEVPPEVKDALKKSDNYYVQHRNSKVFGIGWLPVGMWIYSVAMPSDSSFFGNYWRRLGQAPVIYDEAKAARTARQLEGLLRSKGCFNSTATFDTLKTSGKKITIGFHLTASPRYLVDEVSYHTESPEIRRLLDQWQPGSNLKAGTYYDQEILSEERGRLVGLLRESGYYLATTDNISFQVDTTYNSRHLSIDVNVDSENLRVFHINNIFIYPNSTAGLRSGESTFDTTIFNYTGITRSFDYQIVRDVNKPVAIKNQTIARAMMLFPGMTYRPSHISNTYNSLLNLRNFKYINIDFNESPSSTDSIPLVDAHVRLINSTQQKITVSFELTNASSVTAEDTSSNFFSSGNLGLETSIEYQHKNLFGGAELFKVKSSLLMELPKFILKGGSGGFYDNFSTFEVNLDASLDIPEAYPFTNFFRKQNTRPHTLFNLGGSYQYRYWFERVLFNTSFGYTWTHRPSLQRGDASIHQHQLLPIEMTYVRLINMDEMFFERLVNMADLRLIYQYSSHFIFDARYDYTYTNQQYGTRNNFSRVHFSLESAGLLLNTISRLTNANTDSIDVMQFFDVPFSQYLRGGAEFTRYFYHHSRSTFVTRILLGIGIPYGNSFSMPYEKSFFGGGPTTIRAWHLRTLGPGSYNSEYKLLDCIGDLQLVVNLEERFPFAGIFEGALFADLGNIWLLNSSAEYPGGDFQWDSFFKEMAVGIGLGIRINLSIATIRFDFAIPLHDPAYPLGERWRLKHWAFNQIITNFGINYPF